MNGCMTSRTSTSPTYMMQARMDPTDKPQPRTVAAQQGPTTVMVHASWMAHYDTRGCPEGCLVRLSCRRVVVDVGAGMVMKRDAVRRFVPTLAPHRAPRTDVQRTIQSSAIVVGRLGP